MVCMALTLFEMEAYRVPLVSIFNIAEVDDPRAGGDDTPQGAYSKLGCTCTEYIGVSCHVF